MGGLWALIMLAVLLAAFWYFLRVPRTLQKLGGRGHRAMVVEEEGHFEAKPRIDEAERRGPPDG